MSRRNPLCWFRHRWARLPDLWWGEVERFAPEYECQRCGKRASAYAAFNPHKELHRPLDSA